MKFCAILQNFVPRKIRVDKTMFLYISLHSENFLKYDFAVLLTTNYHAPHFKVRTP